MEVHSRTEDALPTKFVSKVMEIPVVKFGLAQATGLYARVKVSFMRNGWTVI